MTLYIDVSPGRGLGVFASKDFKKGEKIEECPVIILTEKDSLHIDQTILSEYQFEWGPKGEQGAICLGYGSLYNHSHEPNAEFKTVQEERKIVFTAAKDIRKGEEILTDYDWDPSDPTVPQWFKPYK